MVGMITVLQFGDLLLIIDQNNATEDEHNTAWNI